MRPAVLPGPPAGGAYIYHITSCQASRLPHTSILVLSAHPPRATYRRYAEALPGVPDTSPGLRRLLAGGSVVVGAELQPAGFSDGSSFAASLTALAEQPSLLLSQVAQLRPTIGSCIQYG